MSQPNPTHEPHQVEVIDELGSICSYCVELKRDRRGCCGEVHFEEGYFVRMSNGEEHVIPESELEVKP